MNRTPIDINSPHNPRLKQAAKLRDARGRRQQQRILIEGVAEVGKAIEAGVELLELFYDAEAEASPPTAALLRAAPESVARLRITAELWGKLAVRGSGARLLATARPPSLDLSRWPPTNPLGESPLVLVLESIEKPGNLGAVARTADGAGVSGVIVADPVCEVLNPNAIRASLGAVFSLAMAQCHSAEALRFVQQQGLQVVTTEVDATEEYWSVDYRRPTAIVLGSEAQGLSTQWRGTGRRAVRLPMRGTGDSLNVSAAAAAVLYEAVRQRTALSQAVRFEGD